MDEALLAHLPHVGTSQSVGLLGGSFDPPHAGHVHITREALKRFRLDRVWWLISPGNPLKPRGPAPLADRMAAARAIMADPRVTVTDVEARLGTRYTAQTLQVLMARHPGVRFVWLMGADNLAQLHRWQRWDWIMATLPMGVLSRPGAGPAARLAPAARAFARFRLPEAAATRLAWLDPPVWCCITTPMIDISSTELRGQGGAW
jgi:nicotinate-nucleotide adenylyltransferase